jgi:hypothetical protein
MTSAQLKAMTPDELAEEVWWSRFSAYCRQNAVSRAWLGPPKGRSYGVTNSQSLCAPGAHVVGVLPVALGDVPLP